MPPTLSQEKQAKYGTERLKSNPSSPSNAINAKKGTATNYVVGSLIIILILVSLFKIFTARPTTTDVATIRVVAAARDILPGVRVGYQDLRYVSVPAEYVSEAMFERTNKVVGRVSTMFIPQKNPIQDSFLHPVNRTLSHSLENHERAMTVKLSEEGLIDHQLYPGDRVDVLVTVDSNGKKYTKTICKNVKVLMATTRDMLMSNGRHSRNQNRITLAVLPDQAELISHAEAVGTTKLIMRNRLATNAPTVYGVSEEDLLPAKARESMVFGNNQSLNIPSAPPVAPPSFLPDLPPVPQAISNAIPDIIKEPVQRATGWVVEVFSGSKKDTYEFPHAPISE